jgi:hypothetical protein
MKFDIPEAKKLIFEMRIAIRWGDMDAMQHVNNTSYFRYLETCRIDWMRSIGCQPDPAGEGPIIVNAFCNFYQQLEYHLGQFPGKKGPHPARLAARSGQRLSYLALGSRPIR